MLVLVEDSQSHHVLSQVKMGVLSCGEDILSEKLTIRSSFILQGRLFNGFERRKTGGYELKS